MKVLITGGSSFLGRHLVPLAHREHETAFTYFQNPTPELGQGLPLDVCDATAVHALITHLQPDAIIHTAASNRGLDMYNTIVTGMRNIVNAAQTLDPYKYPRLIFLSTDVIFNGQQGPYREADPPSPIHAYGIAKATAESIVSQYANHVIIRTSLIYSLQIMDRGTEWIVAALQADEPVTLFTNQRRNPIWANTLSLACLELVTNDYTGILHVAGSQEMTRAELAFRMLDWWQIDDRDKLTLGMGDETKWPADCRLDVSLATAVLNTPLPGVDQVLDQHLR